MDLCIHCTFPVARAKSGSKMTAAADDITMRAVLTSHSPSTVPLFRKRSLSSGPATCAANARNAPDFESSRVKDQSRAENLFSLVKRRGARIIPSGKFR